MRRSGWRLAVSAILFAGWIGYLTYLVATSGETTVLSRPQFLVADLYVIADVKGQRFWQAFPAATVAVLGASAAALLPSDDGPGDVLTVKEVIWTSQPGDLKGKMLFVNNLHDFGKRGWRGPGEYIVPLSRASADGPDVYEVTRLPKTPGFPGSAAVDRLDSQWQKKLSDHIYRLTPATHRQAEKLAAEFHP
jgi:hypothetical protein